MNKKIVQNSITIQAPVAHVWNALVDPEQTKQYMFGCAAVSDWKPGSPLLWKGSYEGKEIVFVKGWILEIVPQQHLKYTVMDPNASYPDIPENYLHVTYDLAAQNGATRLTVTQDHFEEAAEGEKRYKDVANNGEGWNPVLQQIKEIVEKENDIKI